jgi:transketolase
MSAMPESAVDAAAEQTRLAFGLAVTAMADKDDAVVAISADTLDLIGLRGLIEKHPERVIDVGIAEQNAMGIASGLATAGMRPFLCGYAPFITARSIEQLRNDVAYAEQRVVIGAAASGISLGVSGGTHHALEDLALMRALPNMTAIVPADVHQAWNAVWATEDIDGPVYIRLGGRVPEPAVTARDAAFQVGRADCLRQGGDVTIIACGCLVSEALAATKGIVTAEEHRITGGLGGAVAELLARENPTAMRMVGMPDEFGIVGPTGKVREGYGLSAGNIVASCRELLG